MIRLTLLALGTAGVALLGTTPASADTLPPPSGGTTVTCGTSALQSGLLTQVCAERTGTFVQLYGQISLAGPPSPPSPGSPAPLPPQLQATLTGSVVSGYSLGTVQQYVLFANQTVQVRGVNATIACGSTVHASFSVTAYPWPPAPVTLDLPTEC
ncbi:hypothetical protein [Kitasatospora mediocidica]|uniref:hypothetical protein n=1 Tax=Kitasatospora mediocidica TaxID=58352 RepID=UPI000561C6E7|nr:hypothetical protein [Kitasatospora mediocidica]